MIVAVAFALAACGGGSGTSALPTPPPAQQSRPLSNVVAFMGDSITHRWGLTQFDTAPTLNFGVDGQNTAQMLARFGDVIAAAPGVVVILGGVADLQALKSAATTGSIKAMAAMASAAGIRVILCSVMPQDFAAVSYTRADLLAFNDSLIAIAQENGYLYADYYDVWLNADGSVNDSLYVDGTHPNPDGYAKMWAVIAPLLTEDLN